MQIPRSWSFLALATSLAAQDTPTADDAAAPDHVPVEAFTVPDGLEITLWAKSPLLRNPTNIDVDQHGRIWVTEGVNYRGKDKRRPEGDRVVVLTDTDGDGAADDSKVFVQDPFLLSPLGIAVFDNVVVVSQPPELIVYTDVDRDLRFDPRVDTREVLLDGFEGRNHDHSLHSVTAGPDGLWYWNAGNCGAVFTDRSGKTFRIASNYMDPQRVAGQASDDGHVWVGGFTARMRPDGTAVQILGHNYRNSYEQVVTSFGDVFHSDNDDPPACRVTHVIEGGSAGFASRDGQRSWQADRRPGQSTAVAEWRQEDPGVMPAGDVYGGGSPTGVAFYENGALGEQWQGLLLTCEPGRNTIFGYFPERAGAGFALERTVWLTTNTEQRFVGSDFTRGWDGQLHTQFRPSDVCVGADGAIYVSDWFDGRVGGHQTLDDTLGGAIYRIAPKGFVSTVPTFDLDTLEGQVAALKSPAVNVRQLGRTRLAGIADRQAMIRFVVKANDRNPYVAMRGQWVVLQLDVVPDETIDSFLAAPKPEARLAALRALLRKGADPVELAKRLAKDDSPAVRAEVAIALRDVPAQQAVPRLAEIGERFDGEDRSYLEAFGIGCTGKEQQVFRVLFSGVDDPLGWTRAQAGLAWRLGAPDAVPGFVARARALQLSKQERNRMLTALAFVRDRSAADAMLALAADPAFALRGEALWWCLNRMGNEWREFDIAASLRNTGLYDPETATITPIETPPQPEQALTFSIDDVLALEGDADRGRQRAAACYTCHRIGDVGIEFGPDLSAFGSSQSPRAIVEAILEPSKSISHGYEGHTVETDSGNVDGIVLSRGDPVIVQSQGGVVQLIPESRVHRIRALRGSLMWQPQLFALDAQATADLVAFLQQIAK